MMVNFLEKLQQEVIDPGLSIGTLLQKALLVANECKDQRFLDWARREVNGYASPDGEVAYRKLKGQYVAITFDRRTLPIVWDKDDPTLKVRFLTLPVAEIEALIAGGGDTFAVTVNVDPSSLTKIELEPGDRIGFLLSRATISGFLQAVRQRVLDWTLALKATPENSQQNGGRNMSWDLFISHASEDKDDVARPLADQFIKLGLSVWYDEYTLTVGDSLRRSIDRGLAGCRYGLVILSPTFFQKEWAQKELDGLVAREDGSEKRILPVWHNVSRKDVVAFSPLLADKLGVSTTKGLNNVVKEIMKVLHIGNGQAQVAALPKTQRSQKPQGKAKSGIAKIPGPAGTWVMLDRYFFLALSVQQGQDGTFTIKISPPTAEEEADLDSLRPQRHGSSDKMPFAARNDTCLVRVRGCEKDLSGKQAVWMLILTPEEGGFGSNGMEATINEGGHSYTPDEISRLRAGRLLVNDPPPKAADQNQWHHSLLEGAITGSGKFEVRECIIQAMYSRFGKRSSWKEIARLQAIFLLKATGTVDHVLDLNIGPVRAGAIPVTFRGRRRPRYTGQEPTLIEISGTCSLR
jgi:hypothetical protein